jgi:hydrogenase-4 membrane subunit HyfE
MNPNSNEYADGLLILTKAKTILKRILIIKAVLTRAAVTKKKKAIETHLMKKELL